MTLQDDTRWMLALPGRRMLLQKMTTDQQLISTERREFPSVEVKERFVTKLQEEHEDLIIMKGAKGDLSEGTAAVIIVVDENS